MGFNSFRYGIAFRQADGGRMTGVDTRDVYFGVRLQSSDRNRVERNDLLSYNGNKARGNGDPAQCLNVSCK
jgi:hypothetical protein